MLWVTFWWGRWCRVGENWHFSLLQSYWYCFVLVWDWQYLTWMETEEEGTVVKLLLTHHLFCRGFPWHQTELFRTCSHSNLHPRFYKTLKNAFGKILMLYFYFHIRMEISQQLETGKKYVFSSWKYPGKQLLGPLTFELKIFEQSFLTSPSVVLLIWENKAKIRSLWLRPSLQTVSQDTSSGGLEVKCIFTNHLLITKLRVSSNPFGQTWFSWKIFIFTSESCSGKIQLCMLRIINVSHED